MLPGMAGNCEERTRGGIGWNWSWTPADPGYDGGGDSGWLHRRPLASIQRVAELITWMDSGCMGAGAYNNQSYTAWQAGAWPNNITGHNEGLNVAFADGHVKWQKVYALQANQFCPVTGMAAP